MTPDDPKQVVLRFNKEVLEKGNEEGFKQIMHEEFVNRTPATVSNKADRVWQNISQVISRSHRDDLRPNSRRRRGDYTQGDIRNHPGTIMGLAPTERKVKIDVIDIVRVKDGKYWDIGEYLPGTWCPVPNKSI